MKQEQAWLEWRKGGLGSSDAPVIMGVSPYKTPLQLWREKIGIETIEVNEFITEKGKRLEKEIRERYEFMTGKKAPPILVKHKKYDFLRASLDGYHSDTVVEFKYTGKENLKKGVVIPHHYPQIQHQMYVTDCEKCDYVLYNDSVDEMTIIPVKLDEKYIHTLILKEINFWQKVVNNVEPELSKEDYLDIEDDELQQLVETWKKTKACIDDLSQKEKELKATIIGKIPHNRSQYKDVKISLVERKGSVDYSRIPEIKSINLEEYRGKATTYYKFDYDRNRQKNTNTNK